MPLTNSRHSTYVSTPVRLTPDKDLRDDLPCDSVLMPLVKALNVSGSVLSLHFDDSDAGEILACAGSPDRDGVLALAMLEHATSLARRSPASQEQLMEGVWLGQVGLDQRPLLTIVFKGEQHRSKLVFSAVFEEKGPPDRKLVVATLRRLMPVLDAYYLLWQRVRAIARRNSDLHAALDAIDLGVILVDREGAPCLTNAAAAAVLRENRFLRQRGTTIHAGDLRQTMRLQAALAAAISYNGEPLLALPGEQGAELIKLTAGDDYLIAVVLPVDRPADEPGAAAAMLVMLRPDGDLEHIAVPACRLFGLSSVETKLACHLVAGHSLAEACGSLRIRENTGRSYLKQIFAKTGVNRQTDLIRILLSSIVRVRTRELIQIS